MKIEIWSDIVCPFCYIGNAQFNKALDTFEHKDQVVVLHRSYQLRPDAPTEIGEEKTYESIAEMKGQPVEAVKESFLSLAKEGEKEGLDMKMLESFPISTLKAHQLIHFARKHVKQEQVIEKLYKAYFTDLSNIADIEVLVGIAKDLGLEDGALRVSIESGEFVNAVEKDIELAMAAGVRGVPAYIANDTRGIYGAQGVDGYKDFLERSWQDSRA